MKKQFTKINLIFCLFMTMIFIGLVCHGKLSAGQAPPSPEKRIIGGTDATAGSFLWMAAIVNAGMSVDRGLTCGGSLIHPRWILTAAHCLQQSPFYVLSPERIDVVLNLYDRTNENDGERFSVKRVVIHPRYDFGTDAYDFALLELETPVTSLPLIPLYSGTKDLTGDRAWVLGWGLMENGENAERLQMVEVGIVSNPVCNQAFNNARGFGVDPIKDSMICAGAPGKDSCSGDSGGPLIIRGTTGGFQLAGVVSWGADECASYGLYGVYGRVSTAMDFVRTYIDMEDTPPDLPDPEPDPEPDPDPPVDNGTDDKKPPAVPVDEGGGSGSGNCFFSGSRG